MNGSMLFIFILLLSSLVINVYAYVCSCSCCTGSGCSLVNQGSLTVSTCGGTTCSDACKANYTYMFNWIQ